MCKIYKKNAILAIAAFVALSANLPTFSMESVGQKERDDIFLAIEKGDLRRTERLIKDLSESDINNSDNIVTIAGFSKRNMRKTFLSQACSKNNKKIVELLLSRGAGKSVAKLDWRGKTPIIFAIENGNFDIFKILIGYCTKEFINASCGYYKGKTMLSHACEKNDMRMISFLLENGAKESIEVVDYESHSSLYWACKNNNLELVKILLLEKGAEKTIDMTGFDGKEKVQELMPIYWASKNNNQDSVKLLLEKTDEKSIKAKMRYFENAMPLQPAIENGNLEIVKLLLASGVNAVERSIELAQDKPEILKYLEVTRDYDRTEEKAKMGFIENYKQDLDAYNLLIKRSFAKHYSSNSGKQFMFDNLQKQIGSEQRYKRLQDCCVKFQ